MVQQYKHILESRGIECVIQNEHLSGAAGELPLTECWPVLRVRDEDAARAEALVREAMRDDGKVKASWICPQCHESIEGQFEWCWNCGNDSEP